MSGDYNDAEEYVYIRTCGWEGADRKKPTEKWVTADDAPGSDTFEDRAKCRSLDNPYTLSYEETEPDTPYAIVGRVDGHCLDVDIDVGEGHEETYDGGIEDIHTPRGVLAFDSASGGRHYILKFDEPLGSLTPAEGVDKQGDMEGNLGIVTSPFHHPEYELVNEPSARRTLDDDLAGDDASLNNGFDAKLFEPDAAGEPGETDDSEAGEAGSDNAGGGFEAGESGSSDGESDEYDEYLTDEDIEDALSNIPRDLSYDEWMKMCFAVHDYDGSADGRRLFIDWSREGKKWDSNSKGWVDKFWTHASNGTGRANKTTLGTLIHRADACGWTKPNPWDRQEGLIARDGWYGYWWDTSSEDEAPNWIFAERANFTFDLNAVLTLDDGEYFDVDVVPADGRRYQTQVQPTVFNELRKFKDELVTGTGTVVNPGSQAQRFLNDLRMLLHEQDAPRLEGVKRLGVHENELVTSDGVLTADGWTDNPEHVFIEDGNPLSTALDVPDGEADKADAGRAVELLPQTRDPELFIPAIGWFYATAFRPTILDIAGQFNHLAVFGETGAGKTMTTSVLSQMFGMSENGFNPGDTAFVSLRTLSGGRGLPIWYDEYKPAEWTDYNRNQFHADLRKAAAGQWARRGNADKSVDGYFLSAPVVLTGEQHLQGSAEQRRTIQTKFSTDATTDAECQNAYYELRDECDLRQHARLFYQWVLSQDEAEVRELWDSAGEQITERLPVGEIDDMAEQGLQTVLFGMNIYRRFAEYAGADAPELDVWDSLERLCGETGADARTSHIEEFVVLLERAAVNDYLEEGIHYTFTSGELRINVSRSHDRVSKFIRDHGLTGVDIFDKPGDYTARFRDSNAEWIACVNQNSPPVSRAVGIDVDECDLIGLSAFTDEDEEEGEADNASGGGVTPIEGLNGGFDTIEARVNDVERPDAEEAPTQAGRLVDDSAPVNFVVWGRSPFDLAPDEHYRFEHVSVGEYDGGTQVELVGGITTVEPLDVVGSGDDVERDASQAALDGGGSGDGDGDDIPQAERMAAVTDAIDAICRRDDGAEHARHADVVNLALDCGLKESQAEHALDKLSEQGGVTQPLTGQYRLND